MNRTWRASFSLNSVAVPFGLAGAYVLARLGHRAGILSDIIVWYVPDFICLPLVLGLLVNLQRWHHHNRAWVLPRSQGVAALISCSLYFELLLPRYSESAVGDPWDVVAYAAGWLFFERVLNVPARSG